MIFWYPPRWLAARNALFPKNTLLHFPTKSPESQVLNSNLTSCLESDGPTAQHGLGIASSFIKAGSRQDCSNSATPSPRWFRNWKAENPVHSYSFFSGELLPTFLIMIILFFIFAIKHHNLLNLTFLLCRPILLYVWKGPK